MWYFLTRDNRQQTITQQQDVIKIYLIFFLFFSPSPPPNLPPPPSPPSHRASLSTCLFIYHGDVTVFAASRRTLDSVVKKEKVTKKRTFITHDFIQRHKYTHVHYYYFYCYYLLLFIITKIIYIGGGQGDGGGGGGGRCGVGQPRNSHSMGNSRRYTVHEESACMLFVIHGFEADFFSYLVYTEFIK